MKMKTTLTLLLIMELYGLSSGIKRHFFVNQLKKWCSAQQHCKTYFHDLSAYIDASEEQWFLSGVTNQTNQTYGWVGLHKKPQTAVWMWSGGIQADQISWDTGMNQPDNGFSQNCAFLYQGNNKLRDESCYMPKSFFCMTNFALVPQRETWDGAQEYCTTHYKDLASLSTKARMDSALLETSQAETDYVWIGLSFLAGDWLWVSGDDLNYTAWKQNQQPQCPARDLRCGALDKQTNVWTSRNCEEKFSFFCQ